jgi:sugar (pentulose or hexulose) kinase
MLTLFDGIVNNPKIGSIRSLLPTIKKAGEEAGSLNETGARLLGIRATGIPVAAAEGDQVAALAGSLIGKAGTISCCFGTSVCANVIGDKMFCGVSNAIDHFCAADGKPINMVWLRNGTTFLNAIISSYGGLLKICGCNIENNFEAVMPLMIEAPDDCGGILALPFMYDEPGLDVVHGGSAVLLGFSETNNTVGNIAKAALLSIMFNLKIGCEILNAQGYPRDEIILTGGLTKTPACGQILANVFNTPVTLLESSEEGSSWGAAVMAKYRHDTILHGTTTKDWSTFLESIPKQGRKIRFMPVKASVAIYESLFVKYRKLLQLQPQFHDVQS